MRNEIMVVGSQSRKNTFLEFEFISILYSNLLFTTHVLIMYISIHKIDILNSIVDVSESQHRVGRVDIPGFTKVYIM